MIVVRFRLRKTHNEIFDYLSIFLWDVVKLKPDISKLTFLIEYQMSIKRGIFLECIHMASFSWRKSEESKSRLRFYAVLRSSDFLFSNDCFLPE